MSDVTVIVTRYDNPPAMLNRALSSVYRQTMQPEIAMTDRGSNPYESWHRAISQARTKYVCLLHDDDWHLPTFIERCRAKMHPECGFVFSNATIHYSDRTVPNFRWTKEGYVASKSLSDSLRQAGAVISPSCAMLRRDDALNTLLPGGVPLAPKNGVYSGPDMLLTLLLLLKYPCAMYIADPLANFAAHAGSTTISSDPDKLRENYEIAWGFYDAIKGSMR